MIIKDHNSQARECKSQDVRTENRGLPSFGPQQILGRGSICFAHCFSNATEAVHNAECFAPGHDNGAKPQGEP